MNQSCFCTSDRLALNSHQLYDDNTEEGHLWLREDQNSPLPPCSSIPSPPDSRCLVCLDQKVYAVCRNLMEDVKMVLELVGPVGTHVEISKSECPNPPSDVATQWLLPVVIISVLLLLLFIIGVVCYKCRGTLQKMSRKKTLKDQDETPVRYSDLPQQCDIRAREADLHHGTMC